MNRSLSKWFVLSAATILAITGIAKIGSQFGDWKFLAVDDPITGLKFGQLMLAVGLFEIAIVMVCCFSKRQTLTLSSVAWISTLFAVYRFGLWWMNWKSPCGCIGQLADALHLSPNAVDQMMKIVLAYLLVGSYGLLLFGWLQSQNRTNTKPNEQIRGQALV